LPQASQMLGVTKGKAAFSSASHPGKAEQLFAHPATD
jgi:hypothetical protein